MINLNHVLFERRLKWAIRYGKVTLLHGNAPTYTAKPVKDILKSLGWDILLHPPYPPDLAPSDYHLFALMGHALAEQHFGNGLTNGLPQKPSSFFHGIHNLPERWTKYVETDG